MDQLPLGTPGDPVPLVDADDLKALWQLFHESERRHPGEQIGLSALSVGSACKPGVNPGALWFRVAMLRIIDKFLPDAVEGRIKDGVPDDGMFRAIAQVPMKWIGHEEHEGLPFDVEEFMRLIRET